MLRAALAPLIPNEEIQLIHLIRRGAGKPLLLVHGLGGHWQSWNPIIDRLAASREVILFDLPGHGAGPQSPTAAPSTGWSGASSG